MTDPDVGTIPGRRNLLPQKIDMIQVGEFHVAASRLSECADQEIDLARARGFELGRFVVGVRLGVVIVRLRPILGVEAELDLEPAVEERHDCHHPRIDCLRFEAIVLQFVLVFENILAAVFVRELFADESREVAEVLALGLHGPSGSAGEFQIGEVCVYLILDDSSPHLNKV